MTLSKRTANNIAEYILIFSLVGFVAGYAVWTINPEYFKAFFKSAFNSNNQTGNMVTIDPIDNS